MTDEPDAVLEEPDAVPEEPGPAPVPLLEPRDGLPPVIDTPASLAETVATFAAGEGPVAADAERASGYRYHPRAYLVQLRRAGAGTALVDPVALPDLSPLGAALADAEWVLHAANQDIPSLAAVGMRPPRLFDTELAGRLLGLPRVGLGPLVESQLGYRLEKGHSAADWSTRPLPDAWLRYAALDVELLLELRDVLEQRLREAGKLDWAHEEFAAVAAMRDPVPRADPWRRTSGVHRVRDRRRLAVVRELWRERDRIARDRDISPGRVLSDAAIVDVAANLPRTMDALLELPTFHSRGPRRRAGTWLAATRRALELPDSALPRPVERDPDAPPSSVRAWADRDPAAAARLRAVRAAVTALAEHHSMPVENLLAPEALRRTCWAPPDELTTEAVAAALRGHGARPWQVALTAEAVAAALRSVRSIVE